LGSIFEPIELRAQCEDNRQSSTEVINPKLPIIGNEGAPANDIIDGHLDMAHRFYNKLLDAGVAREQARMILPLATTTKIHMTGSIRSWIHFLELRDDGHAQKEIQLIAQEIKRIFIKEFPIISKALKYEVPNKTTD
jgi:thymidylate synthase (FAD)